MVARKGTGNFRTLKLTDEKIKEKEKQLKIHVSNKS